MNILIKMDELRPKQKRFIDKIKKRFDRSNKQRMGYRERNLLNEDIIRSTGDRYSVVEIEPNSKEWKALMEHSGPTVYVIKCETFYKIGQTKGSIQSRLKHLQMANPFKLELVFSIKTNDCKETEAKLHKLVADKRVNGEWFSLKNEDFLKIEHFVTNELWKTKHRNS